MACHIYIPLWGLPIVPLWGLLVVGRLSYFVGIRSEKLDPALRGSEETAVLGSEVADLVPQPQMLGQRDLEEITVPRCSAKYLPVERRPNRQNRQNRRHLSNFRFV